MASQAHASGTPRQCAADDYNAPAPADGDDVAVHRTFDIPVLVYLGASPQRTYGFNLDLLVDETGGVLCQSARTLDGDTTAQRDDLLSSVSNWHYKPFVLDASPARVMVTEAIHEEARPVRHIPMPDGPLFATKITLYGYGFIIELQGDGQGTYYDLNSQTSPAPRHDFDVSPGEVAALVEQLRAADAWSLDDAYIRRFPDNFGTDWLKIEIAGQAKTIKFLNQDRAGMPQSMIAAIAQIRQLGQFDRWFHYAVPPPVPAQMIPLAAPATFSE